jgi:hypothetical protein
VFDAGPAEPICKLLMCPVGGECEWRFNTTEAK